MENCWGDTCTRRRKLRRTSQQQADFIVTHPIESKWETGTQAVCGIFDNACQVSTCQSGNRKMYSTETALIIVTDNILKAVDEKSASLLVLLDMPKAFDSLNHNLLLGKLRKLGLKASVISWFNSYLSIRYQRVRYKDSVSELLPLTNGVPQD